MDLENMYGLMEKLTRVSGKMVRCKDMDNSIGKNKDSFIKESTKMILNMEKDRFIGIWPKDIEGVGIMDFVMVMDN